MLHTIRLPKCQANLRWVVSLQRALLAGVCRPETTSSDVSIEWIARQLQQPDLDNRWIARLAARRDTIRNSGRSVLDHLKTIADFPTAIKERLLTDFDRDHRFLDCFGGDAACRLTGVSKLKVDGLSNEVLTLRGFLESFYSPGFYSDYGYVFLAPDRQTMIFHRDTYLHEFLAENRNLRVCPYCDGDLGSPEMDHFFPKSKYPSLSCHPLNLVPACHTCNSRENKGEKPPLDADADSPIRAWFHPFLQPATGSFEIQFVRDGNATQPVLHHSDPLTQQRLGNLTKLVGLDKRWRVALSRKIRATQKKIWKHFGNESDLDFTDALCNKFSEWAESTSCEFGLEPFALLEHAFLRSAARREVATYDELWIYATGFDAVTGE